MRPGHGHSSRHIQSDDEQDGAAGESSVQLTNHFGMSLTKLRETVTRELKANPSSDNPVLQAILNRFGDTVDSLNRNMILDKLLLYECTTWMDVCTKMFCRTVEGDAKQIYGSLTRLKPICTTEDNDRNSSADRCRLPRVTEEPEAEESIPVQEIPETGATDLIPVPSSDFGLNAQEIETLSIPATDLASTIEELDTLTLPVSDPKADIPSMELGTLPLPSSDPEIDFLSMELDTLPLPASDLEVEIPGMELDTLPVPGMEVDTLPVPGMELDAVPASATPGSGLETGNAETLTLENSVLVVRKIRGPRQARPNEPPILVPCYLGVPAFLYENPPGLRPCVRLPRAPAEQLALVFALDEAEVEHPEIEFPVVGLHEVEHSEGELPVVGLPEVEVPEVQPIIPIYTFDESRKVEFDSLTLDMHRRTNFGLDASNNIRSILAKMREIAGMPPSGPIVRNSHPVAPAPVQFQLEPYNNPTSELLVLSPDLDLDSRATIILERHRKSTVDDYTRETDEINKERGMKIINHWNIQKAAMTNTPGFFSTVNRFIRRMRRVLSVQVMQYRLEHIQEYGVRVGEVTEQDEEDDEGGEAELTPVQSETEPYCRKWDIEASEETILNRLSYDDWTDALLLLDEQNYIADLGAILHLLSCRQIEAKLPESAEPTPEVDPSNIPTKELGLTVLKSRGLNLNVEQLLLRRLPESEVVVPLQLQPSDREFATPPSPKRRRSRGMPIPPRKRGGGGGPRRGGSDCRRMLHPNNGSEHNGHN